MIKEGDALTLSATQPAQSVNCIVTSPPYFNLRDYLVEGVDWPEVRFAPMTGLPEVVVPAQRVALGMEKDLWSYIGHLVLIFRELRRALRDDGTLWLNIGDGYAHDSKYGGHSGNKNYTSLNGGYQTARNNRPFTGLADKNLLGIPWRVAFALQASGWYLRNDVIWAKTNPMPESVTDRLTKSHEHIFLMTKSQRYWFDHEAIKVPAKNNSGGPFSNRYADAQPSHGGASQYRRADKSRTFRRENSQLGQVLQPGNTVSHRPDREEKYYTDEMVNRRDVWAVSTKSFKDAHFATFNPELIEPCILAGCPPRVCVECGQPWQRDIDHGSTGDLVAACGCDAATRPGLVLDPFLGSGTTAEVAIVHNRRWLGFEMNPEYITMTNQRLHGTQRRLVEL